jgi:pectinesterase
VTARRSARDSARPILIALAALAAAAPAAAQPARAGRLPVRAENPTALARRDETVALAWAAVARELPAAAAARVRVVDAGTGRELPSQAYDANADGAPDSLLFQADFAPREARAFAVEALAPAAPYPPRTFARHDDPRDDMAWESDRIAWRVYGQGLKKTPSAMSSSGVDVWVKRTRDLIVDRWYKKGHDAYHVDTGEGADFFDVGETLGAGGTAVWRDGRMYRADNFARWRLLANGPVRTVFELEYDPWDAGGLRVRETKRVAIDAGSNLYRQESTFRTEGGGAAEVPYVIGELKRAGMVGATSRARAWAWLTGWGPVSPKKGGHGEMGTAVLLPRDRVADWKETDDHYLAVSRATPGVPVVHYVGAGWTASGDFRDVRDWWRYLDEFAERLASPLRVTVGAAAASAAR